MNVTMTARNGFSLLSAIPWTLAMIVAVAVGASPRPAASATFTVTSDADTIGSCGTSLKPPIKPLLPCTLRTAITEANTHPSTPGAPHVINFDIGAGAKTISLRTELPHITQPVIIDGTTQQALKFVGGTSLKFTCVTMLGHPCIELDGATLYMDGLTLIGGNATVRGLVINRFNGNGITIESSGNIVEHNYIGTDATGALASAPRLVNGVALMIPVICNSTPCGTGPVANNVIRANVISGNSQDGVLMNGNAVHDNRVVGNFVGITADGSAAIPNANGVVIRLGSGNNWVGGTTLAERNVISGNGLATGDSGVVIDAANIPEYTVGNHVLGNYIGTDATATHAVGNLYAGVLIKNAQSNTIGGDASGSGNVVGGNFYGISVEGQSYFNAVQGNYVGTSAASVQLGNSRTGVNLIGATSGNVIVSNTSLGNGADDMSDSSAPTPCSNTWLTNMFQTDNEQDGPAAGCIR
jgi:CSLREA domain-containing protein